MAEPRGLFAVSDAALVEAIRGLGADLAIPPVPAREAAPDPARAARLRIEAGDPLARRGLLGRLGLTGGAVPRRPLRRSLVLAIAALLVLAAIAGAIGFGLPGLRIIFAPAPGASAVASPPPARNPTSSPAATPTPTPGPPGSALHLGNQTTLAEATAAVGYRILLPSDPRLGPPDTVWIDGVDRVTLVWGARAGLPAIPTAGSPAIGFILSEFPGHMDEGYFAKLLDAGTTIETVEVGDATGYWISGQPHQFVYVGPSGEQVFETRRLVSDTLAWSASDVTYRIESGLGKDGAIAVAEGLR